MTMTEWYVAELESEATESRRVLEQVPTGKRDWKPHERSMEFGYLSDLVANLPSWVGMPITLDELDVAPKDGPQYKPASLNTSAKLVAALRPIDLEPQLSRGGFGRRRAATSSPKRSTPASILHHTGDRK